MFARDACLSQFFFLQTKKVTPFYSFYSFLKKLPLRGFLKILPCR